MDIISCGFISTLTLIHFYGTINGSLKDLTLFTYRIHVMDYPYYWWNWTIRSVSIFLILFFAFSIYLLIYVSVYLLFYINFICCMTTVRLYPLPHRNSTCIGLCTPRRHTVFVSVNSCLLVSCIIYACLSIISMFAFVIKISSC